MPDTSASRSRALRAPRDRRLEVVEAARELFFQQGYRGTTIQQIAARAGYSKRTVYLDFETKDELFMTICAEGGELILAALGAIPEDRFSVAELVDAFVEFFITFSRDHHQYFRMIFSEATPEIIANCSMPLREQVARLERECLGVVVAWVERAIREELVPAVDPWETAGILVGAATGITLLSMGGSQTVFTQRTREELVRKAVQTYWRGLRCTEPADPAPAPTKRPAPAPTKRPAPAPTKRPAPARRRSRTK